MLFNGMHGVQRNEVCALCVFFYSIEIKHYKGMYEMQMNEV